MSTQLQFCLFSLICPFSADEELLESNTSDTSKISPWIIFLTVVSAVAMVAQQAAVESWKSWTFIKTWRSSWEWQPPSPCYRHRSFHRQCVCVSVCVCVLSCSGWTVRQRGNFVLKKQGQLDCWNLTSGLCTNQGLLIFLPFSLTLESH